MSIVETVKESNVFPEVFTKDKKGKVRTWKTYVEAVDDIASISVESGIVGGKITKKTSWVRKGTNVGRSNEKNPFEVANFKAGNNWQDKYEHNYVLDINDVDLPPIFIYPMLALTAKKQTLPCWAQGKLDGIRAFSIRAGLPEYNYDPTDQLTSRGGKDLPTLSHIKKACDEVFGDHTNHDGEVYLHGVPLQDISGMSKKDRDGLETLEYHVYDIPIVDVPFTERLEIMKKVVPTDHPVVKLVETYWIETQEEYDALRERLIGEGYEGIITRTPDGLYGFDDRGQALKKSKDFQDEEFEIVDYTSEEYDDKGTIKNIVIWICQAGEYTFNCRPKGTVLNKELLLKNADKMIGKQLTVRYLTKSNKGIPIGNPVGANISTDNLSGIVRDYE